MSNVLNLILTIVIVILSLLYLPQMLYMILGLFLKPKRYKEAKVNHKFAIVICAHDEEKVIGKLIDSINNQDYPRDKFETFVILDNCVDKTKEICESKNVITIENTSLSHGKGYALDFGFSHILSNHEYDDVEAFIIFDADNILKSNYLTEMNKCFDSGIKCATSFRNAKNYKTNYISATSEIFFLRESALVHKVRSLLNIGTFVSGTGFYVSRDIVIDNNGWKFFTMTEDIEFSINEALKDRKIGFCDDAEFYDEQPVDIKTLFNQRLRWCKGTNQCFFKYIGKLFTHQFTNHDHMTLFELAIHVIPIPGISFVIWLILSVLFGIDAFALHNVSNFEGWMNILRCTYSFIGVYFIVSFISGLCTFFVTYKKVDCKVSYQFLACFFFPFSCFIYVPLSLIALFKKVKWKKIEHNGD